MAKKAPTLPPAALAAVNRAQRSSGMTTRAWTATRKLTSMLPMLERYARAVLRDPKVQVHVTASASSYTDGKNIYIQPPMRLGDNLVHEVGLCGNRGENKRLVCQACDLDEIVMSLLYHEVSHMAFGSFVTPEKLGRKAIASLVVEWHPPQACDHGVEILEAMATSKAYLEMAGHFDDRLPLTMNGFEDARVNASMLRERPGTKVMLDARTHEVFSQPLELMDGKIVNWPEIPVDAQVSVGMLLAASGYHEHLDALHEDAREILADEVLVDLADKIGSAKDAHELAVHTASAWRRFQELGIMLKEKCVPPPPEDDDDQGDDEEQEQEQEPQPDEDAGEQPDLGSLGNEGQPSPSDGDGEGGSSTDDQKEDDGADSSGDQRQSDPTASSGSGSSSAPGSGAGEDQRESGMSNVPDSDQQQDGAGGGDSDQDDRSSDTETDIPSAEAPGGDGDGDGDDGNEQDADGGNSGGPEPDGGEGDAGEELTDGETAEQESEGAGDSTESADAESEGGSPGDPSEKPGDGSGTGSGEGGGGTGGDEGDEAEDESLRDGGPDEGEPSDPADYSSATLEELTAAIQAGSLHEMFDDQSTDSFASGESVLNKHPDKYEAEMWAAALVAAMLRSHWFEGPSEQVGGVRILEYGETNGIAGFNSANVSSTNLAPTQTIIGPVVNKGRVAFSPNKRSRYENNLKSGKINPRALRRIPEGAEDLFRKKHVAAKRSYHVIITMDVSGSTASRAPSEHYPEQTTLEMMQRSVFAQAEALSRLGISFEVWAHTADWFFTEAAREEYLRDSIRWDKPMPPMDIWLLQVKQPGDKWNDEARQRMHSLRPLGGNLDGHTLQIMRKRADEMKRKFTDVIICYYTDGAMPASNAQEEGRLLKEETALCKRKGYPLLAVAAGTDSPKAWGFDTVQIDSDNDLPEVMKQLERAIL